MSKIAHSDRIIDLVNKLSNDGSIDRLMKAGLISPKVVGYREMFLQYDINRRVKGMKQCEAKYGVAFVMNCDYSTVERAVKAMSKTG